MLQYTGMRRIYVFFCVLSFSAFLALPGLAAFDLSEQTRGRILLDVENNGEAWYVHPLTDERFYLGRPADAFNIMRFMGLGISDVNLGKIPRDNQAHEGDVSLRQRLSGRILLQVESVGEAWYVNPVDLKRYYLGRPADAFNLMRQLGLGITHDQLSLIPDGGVVSGNISNDVPFTAQAPFGEWSDLRQQEGCEEASALMAVSWARGQTFTLDQAKAQILAMSDWEKSRYGYFIDTSAQDTADRLIKQYMGFDNFEVKTDITAKDIRDQLFKGNLVIVPLNGKAVRNPYFRGGGPLRHMLVVTGYDWANAEFITNEPGTRQGYNYRYSFKTLDNALRDYLSGEYVPIPDSVSTAMIVVKP